MVDRTDLLAGKPAAPEISAHEVRESRAGTARQLIVLDDDPTGTQSVAELPVLNAWAVEDLRWALGTGAAAVYVMTNSRSLSPADAEQRNREVITAALEAARKLGVEVAFVSRSDSTLRGHFPLEPDVICELLAEAETPVDGVLVIPAFGDAGRITVDGVHYAGSDADGFVPVGETEFANDATFGYASSDLREWVQEKTEGRISAENVVTITLDDLRGDRPAAVDKLLSLVDRQVGVVDIVAETDLRSLALALFEAESQGKRFVFRVGPPFVRAYIGQDVLDPLTTSDVRALGDRATAAGGLIVVGSHVGLTTRQLDQLRERRNPAEIEIDVPTILSEASPEYLSEIVEKVVALLADGDVVVRTSRTLVKGTDGDDSLRIARAVSDAVVHVVRNTLDIQPPRFVVAKGGITSSDVAARGLEISRAMVRGPMLPGIVSLWEPIEGPATGIPYIVFAGNVGNDQSLADVVDKLSS